MSAPLSTLELPPTHGERPGLTSVDAARLLVANGPNEIKREEAASPWVILGGQFKSPVICSVSHTLAESLRAVPTLAAE